MLTVTYSIVALELEQKKYAGTFHRFRNIYVTAFEIFVLLVASIQNSWSIEFHSLSSIVSSGGWQYF